jgi:hypothetical protein
MANEQLCTVKVMLNGQLHSVLVSGRNSQAFAFEPTTARPLPPTPLRFRCEVCDSVAKLSFVAPSTAWRRPCVVRSVSHDADE